MYLPLLLLNIVASKLTPTGDMSLKKVHVIFRHGHRNPAKTMWVDNDTCAAEYLKDTSGDLTDVGRKQMKLFGRFLRNRYDRLIGANPDKIQVYHSIYERTRTSAVAVLQGIFNHIVDPEKYPVLLGENFLGPVLTNQSYLMAWIESIPKPDYFLELLSACNKHSIIKCSTFKELLYMADQMIVEIDQNCKLPDWMNERLQDELHSATKCIALSMSCGRPYTFCEDHSGGMLKHIHSVFSSSYQNTKDVHLFSLHDAYVLILLSRMGIWNSLAVPFGGAAIIELHRIDRRDFVRTFYTNSTDYKKLYQFKLPNCSWDCPYESFFKLTAEPSLS